jgi:hypothetical protein
MAEQPQNDLNIQSPPRKEAPQLTADAKTPEQSAVTQSDDVTLDPKASLEPALKLVVALIGLAYGTGYLVVLTFLDSYGIHESGGELFKLRYIYVGALALACPVAMAFALQGLFSGKHRIPPGSVASKLSHFFSRLIAPAENMPASLIIMLLNLLVVFYCIIVFAHPGMFAKQQVLINCLYVPLLLTLFLRLIFGERFLWSRRLNLFRWLLAIATLAISILILRGIDFWAIAKGRAYNYIVLQVLFFFFVYRFTKWSPLGTSSKEQFARLVVRVMVLGPIFLLGIFSFSHTVYNHIPAEKGGGDFSELPDARVCFSDTYRTSIPTGLLAGANQQPSCTVAVKVLEESSTDVYVARSSDRGAMSVTDAPNPAVLWGSGSYRPVVFDISRSAVSNIVILNDGDTKISPEAPVPAQACKDTDPTPQAVSVPVKGKLPESKSQ